MAGQGPGRPAPSSRLLPGGARNGSSRCRDREIVLAGRLRGVAAGERPDWRALPAPLLRRRVGYLVDLVQHLRGQTPAEAAALAELRAALGELALEPFWLGERPLPPGTDPIAERWGYTRGVDVARLRRALRQPLELLPERT
jgi:hypothetical protein